MMIFKKSKVILLVLLITVLGGCKTKYKNNEQVMEIKKNVLDLPLMRLNNIEFVVINQVKA